MIKRGTSLERRIRFLRSVGDLTKASSSESRYRNGWSDCREAHGINCDGIQEPVAGAPRYEFVDEAKPGDGLSLGELGGSLKKIADSLESLNNVAAATVVRISAAVGAVERACDLASSNPPTVASRVASAAVSSFAKVVMR